ncbi:MAG TPA: putative glycoside hydrolase [Spirochaetota bacterium]|nr:putative glycoside hydrolase [Spirochaetota bacterium]
MENIKKKNVTLKRVFVILLFIFALQCQSTEIRAVSQEKQDGTSKVFMRALYIPNSQSRKTEFIKSLITKGKPLGINMLVMDVHTFGSTTLKVNTKVLEYLKSEKIYTTARVVCFQDGINQLPVSESKMKGLYDLVAAAADSGFDEIQLDYIRFQDGGIPYPLKKKYGIIEDLLKNFRKITDERKVKLSADIFGRIVYNHNDLIGQKLEVFAAYTDVIYPMLYPSHYTGDRQRMSAPGETVKEGTLKGLKRLEGKNVAIQPYIQAFPYNIQHAKVKLDQYVALQIKGVEETGARGWVAWNPNGDYSSVFSALSMDNSKIVSKAE